MMSLKRSQEVPYIIIIVMNNSNMGMGKTLICFFKCQKIVDENLPEIFKLIESKLDPQKVCSAMGLCAAFKDLVHHPEVKISYCQHFEHKVIILHVWHVKI